MIRRRRKQKLVEVYPKRDPSVKTLNLLPDLSIPDRNPHLTIRSSTGLGRPPIPEPKKPLVIPRTEWDKEMVERERIAQEEIKRKEGQVTILYNKGGYQLPCAIDDPKSFGRK